MTDTRDSKSRFKKIRSDAAAFFSGSLGLLPLKIFYSGFVADIHVHPGYDEKTLFMACAPETWVSDFHQNAQIALGEEDARGLAALLLGFADAMETKAGADKNSEEDREC